MMKYVAEFLGTFIFTSVILAVAEPIPIAVALLAAIYFGGKVSGAHYNPAVSVMMYLNKSLSARDLPMYVVAQVGGACAALYFSKMMK